MSDKSIEVFNAFAKHLRFLQFTLVASCIALVSVLLTDRQTVIALANNQIDEIYNYTLEQNWDKEGIQHYLDSTGENMSENSDSIQFVHGKIQHM